MGLLTFNKKKNQQYFEFNIKHLFVLNTILFISNPMSSFLEEKKKTLILGTVTLLRTRSDSESWIHSYNRILKLSFCQAQPKIQLCYLKKAVQLQYGLLKDTLPNYTYFGWSGEIKMGHDMDMFDDY